jgi:LmbE family N-acetylglucosaminyl deacetylase
VAVAVGAGEQRGVARSGARVGVVVVTVGEVGAVIEEKTESAFAELIAVALQIVAAKLVDHDHHDQLGMGVVGGGKTGREGSRDEDGQEYLQQCS